MKKGILVALLLSGVIILFYHVSLGKDIKKNDVELSAKDNTLSIMLETGLNTGNYEKTTRSDWPKPSEGYGFNKTLSKCEKGGNLSLNPDTLSVVFNGESSDKCYVYFDKVELTCDETITISKEFDGVALTLVDYPVENLFKYTISDNANVYKIIPDICGSSGSNCTKDPIIYKKNANQTITSSASINSVGSISAGNVTLLFENGFSCKINISLSVTAPSVPTVPTP